MYKTMGISYALLEVFAQQCESASSFIGTVLNNTYGQSGHSLSDVINLSTSILGLDIFVFKVSV